MTVATMQASGLVGTIANDPELRFSASGTPWVKFRLSVKPYTKGVDVQPAAVYYDVVCFNSLAEHVAEVLSQGDRVSVVGKLEDDSWVGRDGQIRPNQKLVADGIGADLRFSTHPKSVTRTHEVVPGHQDPVEF